MLHFANFVRPEDLYNPDNTAKYVPRVAVDASIPGQWTCSLVPPPMLAHGVVDEGSWPRIILLDGEQVVMQRHEWDMLKLKGTHVCAIPQKGFPTADSKRRQAARYRDDVPELDSDSDSDASSDGAATPRASPSTPSTSFTALPLPNDVDAGLRSGTPMQSVVSRLCSAMSVDTHSLASSTSYMSVDTVRPCDVSSTGAPNAYGKRAKKATHEHPDERARKRVHGQRPAPVVRKAMGARARRRAERHAYMLRRNALKREAEQAVLRAEAAIIAQNLRAAEAHKREVEAARARMLQMDQDERLRQQMFEHLEAERKRAEEALAKRRLDPDVLAPLEALDVWRTRVKNFKEIRKDNKVIHVSDLPFPVLFSPEYSLHLVTEDSVKKFFEAVIPMMHAKELRKARVALHDTHYRGLRYTAGELYKDEADTDFVIRTMTMVAALVNDNYEDLKKHCKPETA
ncbi:hypothetical protein AURDEDRAFT_115177 [Auricularia subglabra TFB-10046 SS5]|nr:hypothetical protein AURDEDRAFT_115177 [Auricularia subglabra TFB-10046 SS5]